jgi:hypothetical protein
MLDPEDERQLSYRCVRKAILRAKESLQISQSSPPRE